MLQQRLDRLGRHEGVAIEPVDRLAELHAASRRDLAPAHDQPDPRAPLPGNGHARPDGHRLAR